MLWWLQTNLPKIPHKQGIQVAVCVFRVRGLSQGLSPTPLGSTTCEPTERLFSPSNAWLELPCFLVKKGHGRCRL